MRGEELEMSQGVQAEGCLDRSWKGQRGLNHPPLPNWARKGPFSPAWGASPRQPKNLGVVPTQV